MKTTINTTLLSLATISFLALISPVSAKCKSGDTQIGTYTTYWGCEYNCNGTYCSRQSMTNFACCDSNGNDLETHVGKSLAAAEGQQGNIRGTDKVEDSFPNSTM